MVLKKSRKKKRSKKIKGGNKSCGKFKGLVNKYGTCWIDAVLTALCISDVSRLFRFKLESILKKRTHDMSNPYYYDDSVWFRAKILDFISKIFFRVLHEEEYPPYECENMMEILGRLYDTTEDKKLLMFKEFFDKNLKDKTAYSGGHVSLILIIFLLLEIDFKMACRAGKTTITTPEIPTSFCSKCLSTFNCDCIVDVICFCHHQVDIEAMKIIKVNDKSYDLEFFIAQHYSPEDAHSNLVFRCNKDWYFFDGNNSSRGKKNIILLDDTYDLTQSWLDEVFSIYKLFGKRGYTQEWWNLNYIYGFYFRNIDNLLRRKSMI